MLMLAQELRTENWRVPNRFVPIALRTELRSYSPPGYKSYLTSGAVISRHIAALHVIHKYIHNSSTEFQDQLCQDQLLAADSSVVDNMKAQVSELGEKLPIAEEVTTAAEQMEFAKEP